MRDQHIAAHARRRGVLLHAGIVGIIPFDRAGMIAAFDHSYKFVNARSRRHPTSSLAARLFRIAGHLSASNMRGTARQEKA
jgi:hypothetical protein